MNSSFITLRPGVDLLFIVASVVCVVFVRSPCFVNTAFSVLSSFSIISPRKREQVALLELCSYCHLTDCVLCPSLRNIVCVLGL